MLLEIACREDKRGWEGWEPCWLCSHRNFVLINRGGSPGETMALTLPNFRNFYCCWLSVQLSERSVWKLKPAGRGCLLSYTWVKLCMVEVASQLAKQSLPINKDLTILPSKHHQNRQDKSTKYRVWNIRNCANRAKSTRQQLKALTGLAGELRPQEKSLIFEVTGIWCVTVTAQ